MTCQKPFGYTEFAPNYTLRDTVKEYKRACAILERSRAKSSEGRTESRRRPVIMTEKSVVAVDASVDASCSVM